MVLGGDIPIGYDVTKTHDTFSHQFKNNFINEKSLKKNARDCIVPTVSMSTFFLLLPCVKKMCCCLFI